MRGTTSAHAENTGHRGSQSCSKRNYLRARGEYFSRIVEDWDRTELPPRTRRIRPRRPSRPHRDGTTSAHAENTAVRHHGCGSNGNYLRARGEYVGAGARLRPRWELPPRTRRIPEGSRHANGGIGTTSAHAENTLNQLGLL